MEREINTGTPGRGCGSNIFAEQKTIERHPRNPHLSASDGQAFGTSRRWVGGEKPSTKRGHRRHAERNTAQKQHAEGVWNGGYG